MGKEAMTINCKGFKGGTLDISIPTEVIVTYLKTQVQLVEAVGPENAVRLQEVTLAGLKELILADHSCKPE